MAGFDAGWIAERSQSRTPGAPYSDYIFKYVPRFLKKVFRSNRSSRMRQERATPSDITADVSIPAHLVISHSTINVVGRNQHICDHPHSGPIPEYNAHVTGPTRTMPEPLPVDCSPSPISAAAQDHYGRSPPTIGVSPQHGVSQPRQGATATTTHNLHLLYAPLEAIVLHVPHPHQRTVMVMAESDISLPSDLGSNTFQHENSRPLFIDHPSPCLCSYVRVTGRTISFMGDPIAEAYSENTLYHTTYPVHDLPNHPSTPHSTGGRLPTPGVTPHSPPPCVLPPIRRQDSHSYLDDDESHRTHSSPLISGTPPPACGAPPGPSHTSPAASPAKYPWERYPMLGIPTSDSSRQ